MAACTVMAKGVDCTRGRNDRPETSPVRLIASRSAASRLQKAIKVWVGAMKRGSVRAAGTWIECMIRKSIPPQMRVKLARRSRGGSSIDIVLVFHVATPEQSSRPGAGSSGPSDAGLDGYSTTGSYQSICQLAASLGDET
jgi:hypothetical protein